MLIPPLPPEILVRSDMLRSLLRRRGRPGEGFMSGERSFSQS